MVNNKKNDDFIYNEKLLLYVEQNMFWNKVRYTLNKPVESSRIPHTFNICGQPATQRQSWNNMGIPGIIP